MLGFEYAIDRRFRITIVQSHDNPWTVDGMTMHIYQEPHKNYPGIEADGNLQRTTSSDVCQNKAVQKVSF